MYKKFFKYKIDFIAALLFAILFSPLFIFVTILLYIVNRGDGAFFIQERPGRDGKIFRIIKYKTMTDKRDSEGNLLPDNERMTKVGRFIRSTSIDELPQIFNVLRLEMSFIGPRPLLKQYLPLYSPQHSRRHEVRPGITGYAQVNGRNNISWQKKFDLDVWYVDNCSFLTDCKILIMSVIKVIRRSDISQSDHTTMQPFNGYN